MFAIEWNNLAMMIFVVGSAAAVVFGLSMYDGQLTNFEALLTEAFFGSVLALYILRLQKKEIDAMNSAVKRIDNATASIKEIARVTAEMIAQEQGRQAKRKQEWTRATRVSLFLIRKLYVRLVERYDYMEKNGTNEKYAQETQLWANETILGLKEQYLPELNESATNLIELVDDATLYRDIKQHFRYWPLPFEVVIRIAATKSPEKPYLSPRSANQAQIEIVDNLIKRVEKEMPVPDTSIPDFDL